MKQEYIIARNQLDGVEAFLRVAERRSFRAAADDLGLSPSAISQTIRALEARVGVPLLTRTTRSVGLTEAGERFLEHAHPAFAGLTAAFEAARSFGERPAGLLRLNVPRAAIPFLVEPVMEGFTAAYPDVEVEICGEDELIDLVERGFDAGIRMGDYLEADMIGIRLTPPFRLVVAGSPGYFAKHGRPAVPADLRDHRCIRSRAPSTGAIVRWHFDVAGQPLEMSVEGPLIVNDLDVAKSAALRGVGLAFLAEPLVAEHIADGRLELVLEEQADWSPGAYLYYPSRTQMLPKLRAFVDFIREHRPPERFLKATGA
ncbi:MAG TPA: LysR family transcriptional regulator [Allosphingosinicella sp.]|jgi:DNA-binding transcriptional LysR family regulator|nr:LysR family transcriptional regulator [Allosphingosinicella sp.]